MTPVNPLPPEGESAAAGTASLTPVVRVQSLQLFWAVLDAPQLAKRRNHKSGGGSVALSLGLLPTELLPDLVEQVPTEVDDLHAVSCLLNDGRVIACAIEKRELATLDHHITSMIPASIPTELDAPAFEPELLNLLVGDFEPRPIRLARTRRLTLLTGFAVAFLGLILMGAIRRWEHAQLTVDKSRTATSALLALGGRPGMTAAQMRSELEQPSQRSQVD